MCARTPLEVHLIPSKADRFAHTQAVPIHRQDERAVEVAVPDVVRPVRTAGSDSRVEGRFSDDLDDDNMQALYEELDYLAFL